MIADPIQCERFELRLMTTEFIEATLAGDDSAAANALGIPGVPARWAQTDDFVLNLRLHQMRANPESAHWLIRAIVAPDGAMLGHAGFHGPPDERGFVELGYTVFEQYRRRGYAAEAATCMMRWAQDVHGVRLFRLSVGEANDPSLALAAKLGFTHVGEQMDEIDGRELIFEREGAL